MPTITTTKYSFKPPESISEMDYYSYKQMLEVEYNIDISPKETSRDPGVSMWNIAKWTAFPLLFILSPAVAISEADSGISKIRANNAMKQFYNDDLKNLIFKTRNYSQFNEEYAIFFKEYLREHFRIEYYMKYKHDK